MVAGKKKRRNVFVKVRSKNDSANPLRRVIPTNGKNVILRLGSKTPTDEITTRPVDLEINTPEACIRSNNKITMKQAFDEFGVKTAQWSVLSDLTEENNWDQYPAIIKHKNSCRGEGIYYIETPESLNAFMNDHVGSLRNYIIEKYHTYSKEYRLHVNKNGCFYSCRKMLKTDAEERWHRHDSNSVWILPENELFAAPSNWDEIVTECIKAMEAVELDICAVDVKVQKKMNNAEFIILETNSAPSLGEVGVKKYIDELITLIENV